ncbi:(d)CMP kinase [Ructibacterium gallinarum]|uniref:Cytidylate kinase n=1 Tax=Ructibacterium gallinarum TaxID=2779355 RepID=A0A9D5R8V6_9FIRM|nr:(d)CMP kinase [Ructibacterium gallinarum]MBE5040405.1 (d)CMP kinase [Ructibacterium gallinarum]
MSTKKIAIDGPAGAGKSTVAKAVARTMGFVYIDTGAMYRAIGLGAVRRGIDASDAKAVEKILDELTVTMKHGPQGQMIFLNGEDVSEAIRMPEISVAASLVAVIPAVRLKLVELQRTLAEETDVIMDGRDIGTYVLPNAQLKVFLTASPEARARRRYDELREKGVQTTFEEVYQDMLFRDKNDSSRAFAPLRPAEDSVLVDSTEWTLQETIDQITDMVRQMTGDLPERS